MAAKLCEICSTDVLDGDPTVEGKFRVSEGPDAPARDFECTHASCLLSWLKAHEDPEHDAKLETMGAQRSAALRLLGLPMTATVDEIAERLRPPG